MGDLTFKTFFGFYSYESESSSESETFLATFFTWGFKAGEAFLANWALALGVALGVGFYSDSSSDDDSCFFFVGLAFKAGDFPLAFFFGCYYELLSSSSEDDKSRDNGYTLSAWGGVSQLCHCFNRQEVSGPCKKGHERIMGKRSDDVHKDDNHRW